LEWFHWRGQVAEAREAITTEMTYNLVGAIARVRSLGCAEQRLDTLSRILDEAARTGSLPPVGDIEGPVRHAWRIGAWESVVASQTSAHFPPEQLAALSSLYKRVQHAEEFAVAENEAWNGLYVMVGPGRRLDPASEADLRKALSVARDRGRTMTILSAFMVNEVAPVDLPFTRAERQELAEVRNRPLTGEPPSKADDARTNEICGPIGAAPPHYGEASSHQLPAAMSEFAKSLPDFGAAP
jgi:hypothetical protein